MTSIPSLTSLRTKFALRLQRQITGKAQFSGASRTRQGGAVEAVGLSKVMDGSAGDPLEGQAYELFSDLGPIAVNDDVWRKRFAKYGRSKFQRLMRGLGRAWAYIKELQSPKYSMPEKMIMLRNMRPFEPDELEEIRRQSEEKRLLDFHIEQAKIIKPQIVETLTRLGFCYSITKNDRKIIKKRIFIGHVDVTPYAYTFYITRLPFGVKATEMAADWVSTELSITLKKKVRYMLDQVLGLRFTVEIGSTLSIPNFVEFKIIEKMPKNLPPLAFWAGLSTNGNPIYRNLADAPHMIIAGSSGAGKSNMQNVVISTLLMRQRPETLRVVFFDLKGGVEFAHFQGIPHLWKSHDDKCDGIIEMPEQVVPALEALLAECNARLARLKNSKGIYKNIVEFNRGKHPKNRMPYIVAFFDEWAVARKQRDGDKAESILANIANLARATGIHFVLSTQYPKAEILNTLISVNFPWRIAFNMSTAASQAVLSNWNAVGLQPIGRAVFQADGREVLIQAPRVTNNTIAAITSALRTGGLVEEMASLDAEEILKWALENIGGKLDRDTLFAQFRDRLSQAALNDLLRSMEEKIFDIDGTLYKVINKGGNSGRRMELAAPEQGLSAGDATDKPQTTAQSVLEIPAPDEPLLAPCPYCSAPRKSNPCEFCGQATEEE